MKNPLEVNEYLSKPRAYRAIQWDGSLQVAKRVQEAFPQIITLEFVERDPNFVKQVAWTIKYFGAESIVEIGDWFVHDSDGEIRIYSVEEFKYRFKA